MSTLLILTDSQVGGAGGLTGPLCTVLLCLFGDLGWREAQFRTGIAERVQGMGGGGRKGFPSLSSFKKSLGYKCTYLALIPLFF